MSCLTNFWSNIGKIWIEWNLEEFRTLFLREGSLLVDLVECQWFQCFEGLPERFK